MERPYINKVCFVCCNPVGRNYRLVRVQGNMEKPFHQCRDRAFISRHRTIITQGNKKVMSSVKKAYKIIAGLKCWGTCNRCGHREMIARNEINRAKGARCSNCGGMLELSKDQQDRMTKARDATDEKYRA